MCEATAQGATFEEWMDDLKPHYAEAHADFMEKKGEMSPEDQQKEMQKWMADNKVRFDAAPEDE